MSPPVRRREVTAGALALAGAGLSPALASRPSGARRGINLPHLLTWPNMSPGPPAVYAWPPFQEARYQISTMDLGALRRAGFDMVRLPVDPAIFLSHAEPSQRRVLEHILRDRAAAILAEGFRLVVDLHPSTENPSYPPDGVAGAGTLGPELLRDYLTLVGDIAALLASFPDDAVAFEPMNEPALGTPSGIAAWPSRLMAMYQAARSRAPKLAIVVGGANYGHAEDLLALDPRPYAGQNVIFTFHSYDPSAFTHQSVAKMTAFRDLIGVPWPASTGSLDQTLAACQAKLDARPLAGEQKARAEQMMRRQVLGYFAANPGEADIGRRFAAVGAWFKAAGAPGGRVLLGEFGCGRTLGEEIRAGEADRERWLATVRGAAQAQGFNWALWAYQASEFSLAEADGTLDPVALRALGLRA
jgi:endoglucanase